MAKDYIPRPNAKFDAFQQNIAKTVVANADDWQIPAEDVTELSDASVEYGKRYKAISNKETCTTSQRSAHNNFRTDYEKQLRKFVNRFLRDNAKVSHSQLVGMDIKVRGKKRGSRSAITDVVSFHVAAMDGCRAKFYCRIPNHLGAASLHPEADGVEIRYTIGDKPVDCRDCPHVLVAKKAQVLIQLDLSVPGKIIYAFARWVNLSNPNLSGPYSVMAHVMLH
jgi:hypothetical protein